MRNPLASEQLRRPFETADDFSARSDGRNRKGEAAADSPYIPGQYLPAGLHKTVVVYANDALSPRTQDVRMQTTTGIAWCDCKPTHDPFLPILSAE
ncbi:hypothetical protein BV898_19749 [Hypsibius exemplaris]|uniref:Uncharacterized protein n=1 Tax=Hypsibius exemplaris TaxID=2072580 RepID=A0A9X6NJI4_HYPEX|nr:hypothetical protein BV898_19749 [Hypsibius exemplaris]